MNDGIIEQVKEALAPVAERLQQGAEFMYGVFYRQTVVEGILQIVVPLLLLLILSIVSLMIKKRWGKISKPAVELATVLQKQRIKAMLKGQGVADDDMAGVLAVDYAIADTSKMSKAQADAILGLA